MALAPSVHNLRQLPLEAASLTHQMQGGRSGYKAKGLWAGSWEPSQANDYSADQVGSGPWGLKKIFLGLGNLDLRKPDVRFSFFHRKNEDRPINQHWLTYVLNTTPKT